MKNCSTCKKTISLINFDKNSWQKDGYSHICRDCRAMYRQKHKDTDKKYRKEYYKLHKKEQSRYIKKWRKENPEKVAQHLQKTYQKNKESRNKKHIEYIKKRIIIDPNFKIARNLRSRLYKAIKNKHKIGSAVDDLGCTIEQLRLYLESKFYSNPIDNQPMTWENYGYYGWHIDHIVPLSSFNLTDKAQFLMANHYKNLQPLWIADHKPKTQKDKHEKNKNSFR